MAGRACCSECWMEPTPPALQTLDSIAAECVLRTPSPVDFDHATRMRLSQGVIPPQRRKSSRAGAWTHTRYLNDCNTSSLKLFVGLSIKSHAHPCFPHFMQTQMTTAQSSHKKSTLQMERHRTFLETWGLRAPARNLPRPPDTQVKS